MKLENRVCKTRSKSVGAAPKNNSEEIINLINEKKKERAR